MTPIRIGIPLKTPLSALIRAGSDWHVWIAVRDTQLPYEQWQGTYLSLSDDGSVTRITVYDDGHEDVMTVKGPTEII